MFMSAHTSVGLWLTTKISNPLVAFLLGFAMHFFLDMIPHGDSDFDNHKSDNKAQRIFELKIGIIDFVFSAILIYSFLTSNIDYNIYILGSALLGSWLPDWIWIIVDFLHIKFMDWYIRLHAWVHNVIGYDFTPFYGVALQLLVTIFFISLVF